MSLKECTSDGMPGYQWGEGGTCHTYSRGNLQSEAAAKAAARADGAGCVEEEQEVQDKLIDDE